MKKLIFFTLLSVNLFASSFTAPPGSSITLNCEGSGGSGSGTCTSVGLSDASTVPIFTISGTPVTTSGTLTETLKTQVANACFAGPTTGADAQPTFRALVGADLPDPASSTKGGVKSYASVSSQWINAISTGGTPSSTQPAFSDISGTASLTTQVTGVLPIANGGTNNSTTLNNGRIIVSGGGSLGEGSSLTALRVLVTNGSNLPAVSATTSAQVAALASLTASTPVKTDASGNLTTGTISLTTQVSGTLPVANGGTGAATLTSASVLVGNGTSAISGVAPSTSGNVLTSNGSAWTSAAPSASGGLTTPTAGSTYGNTTAASITGINNSSIGVISGTAITSGVRNTIYGHAAGVSTTTASDNVFIGDGATGSSGCDSCTVVGSTSNAANGLGHTLFGYGNSVSASAGNNVTIVGKGSGSASLTGGQNILIGNSVATSGLTSGADNICLGTGSCRGNNGAAIGAGNGNILMGKNSTIYDAGASGIMAIGSDTYPITNVIIGQSGATVANADLTEVTVEATRAGGTNQAGKDFNLGVSRGSGSGLAGNLVFQYAVTGSSGTASPSFADGGSMNGATSAWTLGAASTTPQHTMNTATAATANCGNLSTACVQITINGSTRYIPYF